MVDNDTREDCTLVKVDSVNRDGVLLEMVQLLTDLDLVISKSYISSDGGWLMDGKLLDISFLAQFELLMPSPIDFDPGPVYS